MWNKVWWLKGLVVFFVLQSVSLPEVWGQKKWDGGGNDSLWSNPQNWHPDGIPTATDTVILNNEWISSSYTVYFPQGMITSHAFSLRIEPATGFQINVTLPNSNTGAPGLLLYAGDTALSIHNGSIFFNSSGASAGNAIQLTGKLMIKNGGKYVHQTLRGNALLISSLIANAETEKGVFELNVPGNSAYTVSASGRTFGSLVLSGQNTSRKTYTASGSNLLTIKGDLVINEQAAFNSSLTNDIIVSGDVIIKGRFYINPISGDTVGRCLTTNGKNNIIEVSGQFNQGLHFRKWLIAGNYQLQHSIINLDHLVGEIRVQSGSTIDLGNSMIKGTGEFASDSNTSFLSSAISIISNDTLANIQTERINLHINSSFTCYGSSMQSTGNRFPTVIGKLKIDKSQDNLFLSKSIIISDSLLFIQGKLISKDTSSISILHYCNAGNEKSYFTGKIIHLSPNQTLYFPVGKGNLFAPLQLSRRNDAGCSYELAVDSLSPILVSYPAAPPIKQLSAPFYWKIDTHQQNGFEKDAQLIHVKQPYWESDCIAVLDTLTHLWKLASRQNTNDSLLLVSLDSSNSKLFTLGKLLPHVLPLSSIYLQKRVSGKTIVLNWTVDDDENALFYVIEKSSNGVDYQIEDTLLSMQYKGTFTYSKTINPADDNYCFYRIIGKDKDGHQFTSNIVVIQHQQVKIELFPNPTQDVLYLKSEEVIRKISLISPYGAIKSILPGLKKRTQIIPVHKLAAGYYLLVVEFSNSSSTIPFIKQ